MSSLCETSLGKYLDDVASKAPTPGGGSVAAVVAALGAALGSMVTAISGGKSDHDQIEALSKECSSMRETFLRLSLEDQSAFDAVMSALKLSKDDPSRADRVEATVQAAAEAPLTIAQSCLDLLIVLESLVPVASRHCISDVGAAAHLALAALRASLLNVHINITFMKDRHAADEFEASAVRLENEGQARSQRIVNQVVARIRG
ncbi:cyclodeaminase/cyclohydrolase family protein [Candidatus Bipolaricaulota bacterium]|nr:cyclodeaminase/cyclohydrolase family protein [Candidatus Bipolaricaulota bacterium]